MSDKVKWAGFYLSLSATPLLLLLFPTGSIHLPPGGLDDFLRIAPYVGLFAVALLGWQINQTRILWSALLLCCIYHFLLHPTPFGMTERSQVQALQLLSAAYPLGLAIIYGMKESRLFSDWSLARILLALFPFVLLACLAAWAPDSFQKVLFWAPAPKVQVLHLPPFCAVGMALALLVFFLNNDLKIKAFLLAQTAVLMPFLGSLQANLWTHRTGFLPDPFPATVVPFGIITLVLLVSLVRMYLQKVYLDLLTSVYNRQALDERLHTLRGEFALAMVDIDHFKQFNDTYGHAEGDNVLRMVAQHLEDHLGDRVYRYGGEEFCIVFEGEGNETAMAKMEKTRASMAKHRFTLRGKRTGAHSRLKNPFKKVENRGKKVNITVSVGVAGSGAKGKPYEEVIKKADQALYQAKEKGRNRVVEG